jgi:hypothetical protein
MNAILRTEPQDVVVQISAGGSFGQAHSALVTKNGHL